MAGTALVQLTNTAWTLLGAAPVMVQAVNNAVKIAIADSAPSEVGAPGFQLSRDTPNWPVIFYKADGSSNVYAIGLGGPASVIATIISAGL